MAVLARPFQDVCFVLASLLLLVVVPLGGMQPKRDAIYRSKNEFVFNVNSWSNDIEDLLLKSYESLVGGAAPGNKRRSPKRRASAALTKSSAGSGWQFGGFVCRSFGGFLFRFLSSF